MVERSLVHLRWIDSLNIGDGGWLDVPQADEEPYYLKESKLIIDSVGYVVAENGTVLVIANSVQTENDTMAGAVAIPKVAVVKREAIRDGA